MISTKYVSKPLSTLVESMHQGINTAADKVVYRSSGMPIIQSKNFTSGSLNLTDVKYLCDADIDRYKDKYVPEVGDILFSNIGTVGKSIVLDNKPSFMFAWNVFLIRPNSELLDRRYLKYYLDFLLEINAYEKLFTGGTVKFLNKKTIGDLPVPLPSLIEQKRIAAILDKADTIRRKRQQAIQLADDFLRAAFLDMFGDPVTNPKGWRKVTIGEVTGKAITWNPSSLENSVFDYIDLSSVDNETKEVLKYNKTNSKSAPSRARQLIQPGDVLVSTVRPNLNGVAKVINDGERLTASTGFCVLRPKSDFVTQNYLFFVVTSQSFVNEMINKATGASYPAVSDSIIKNYEVELPPTSLLHDFEEKCRIVEAIKFKAKEFVKQNLFESLSQKAFSGQL